MDGADSDDGGKVHTLVCHLPTAPRANRIFDDNSIPHKSPFIAYITNLPFDAKEEDIYEYFKESHVVSVRLPREDGDTGRVRGFGYVEFDTRDDLIQALSIPDPTIKGRRIRIDLSNENEQHSRQRGARRGYDSAEGKDSSNWRRDSNQKRDFGIERNFTKEQKQTSDDNNSPGSWRLKNLSNSAISEPLHQIRKNDIDICPENKSNISERPKLVLKPRTLPIPDLDIPTKHSLESKVNDDVMTSKFTGISAEKVFGSAKPVDTSARDLEIEKRLADVRRQENIRNEVIKTTRDLNELNFDKEEKITIIDQNWRRQNCNDESLNNQETTLKTDKRRENIGYNRKKNVKTEGSDCQFIKDGKRKDFGRPKREFRSDRISQKHTNIQNDHIVQSSNMYSGLDETSD